MQRYTEPWPPWVLGIRTISSAHLCQNHKQIPHFWNLHRQGSFLCCFSCFCCGCRWPSSRCLWIWRKIGADEIDLRKRQGELVLEHGHRGVHGPRELQQRFNTITSSASTSSSASLFNHQMNQEKTAHCDTDSKYDLQFQQKSRWMPTGGGFTRYQAILTQIGFKTNPSGWLRYKSFLKRREERQTATTGISGTTHSVPTLQLAMQTVKWVIT